MANTDLTLSQNLLLANWLNGVEATPQTNISEEISSNLLFGIPLMVGAPLLFKKPYSVWMERNAHPNLNWTQAWNSVSSRNEMEKQALQYLKDPQSRFNTLKNKSRFSVIKGLEADITAGKANTKYYDEAKKLIAEAKSKKMTGKQLKAQLQKIHEAMAKGDLKVNADIQKGLIKPTSKFGKASHFLKSKTGIYKAKGAILRSAKGANALRLASKAVKGSWIMAAIEGAMEIPDIIKSYKTGSKQGNKQLVKSTTKVGASVLGYAGGAAAAGAIAGSVVPGLGNVAGAIVGFVGGIIGGALASWGAGKVMDKVMGEKDSLNKSEAQVAKEEKAKQKAKLATNSSEEQQKLLAEVLEKAQNEGGFDDEATLNAYQTLLAERENELGGTPTYDNDEELLKSQLSALANLNIRA